MLLLLGLLVSCLSLASGLESVRPPKAEEEKQYFYQTEYFDQRVRCLH